MPDLTSEGWKGFRRGLAPGMPAMVRCYDPFVMATVEARLLTLALLLAGSTGCALAPPTRTPIPSEVLQEAASSGCVAVLLPGRWDRMDAFRQAGFDARVQEAGVDLGLVAVDAHIGYYREESLARRLEEDVIEPGRARGARRIWLVGTSLGAVGSLVYLESHPGEIEGVVLIAPYLGEEEVLEEVRGAGSLQQWRPPRPLADGDYQRRIWLILRRVTAPASPTAVLLAFGTGDDFAPGHRLLARELPASRVFRRDGGHDWSTWADLWSDVLASGAVCGGG